MEITLTQNKTAIVDNDMLFLKKYNWHVSHISSKYIDNWYAVRRGPRSIIPRPTILMHRVIVEYKIGRSLTNSEQIDHIDHNGLNNTINNLRIVSASQNRYNQRSQASLSKYSRYKGVSWDKNRNKWIAKIYFERTINIGRFDSEINAAKAYDNAAKQYFGEYAYLNFPPKTF